MVFIKGLLAVIGLAASILTIIQFFTSSRRWKLIVFFIVVAFSAGAIMSWNSAKEAEKRLTIIQNKQALMKNDAKSVADSIVHSGWNDAGDYLGYLSQIVGFFKRHPEKYESEYQTYKRQLDEWQDFFRKKRESNQSIYSSEWRDLSGIVVSGRNLLKTIAESK